MFSDARGCQSCVVRSLHRRLFALSYDPFLAWGERAGMQLLRRDVLADATGSVLEIGAGTGLNAAFYPPGVERVTMSESDPAMRHRLSQRLSRLGYRHEIVDAPADHLPVGSGTVDTAVSTLVLCTVADLAATLDEIRQVLAPKGRLVLIEHVRASEPRLRAWQDHLHRPWRALAEGCHCNRDTLAALHDAGFDTATLSAGRWKRMPAIVSPLVFGSTAPRPPGSASGPVGGQTESDG